MNNVIKYSNQYLISTKEIDFPIQGWEVICLDNCYLYPAPNLDIYRSQHITLLGFAIHVLHPEWDEQTIVDNFPIEQNELLDYLDQLCGIHLVISKSNNETTIYHDAAGVMKMFVHKSEENVFTLASDPKLIQEVVELSRENSKEAEEFYTSDFFLKSFIRLGEKTEFKDVSQILPNHSFSLSTGTDKRYYPRKKKSTQNIETALENTHTYFSNVLKAANRKFNLKCSMTAGWDSRMVLAMTKGLEQNISYYTFWLPTFNDKHEDVKIPRAISSSLNLKHEFISKDVCLDPQSLNNLKNSFASMVNENVDTYLGGFPHFMAGKNALLVGTVSEICKNYYDDVTITDGASFAKAAHFPVIPYTINYLDQKLNSLKRVEEEFDYDLRDIAHWEQDITNFAAKRTLYLFSFIRAFSPFNARIILDTILSTPREMRDKQEHEFYRLYLEKFYPELLKFPINPSLKQQLIRLGKKIGVYGAYKKISTKLRK